MIAEGGRQSGTGTCAFELRSVVLREPRFSALV